ncbi:MAG: KpsF/GutQ family sugar-phosphate isomerase [Planctomycetales bacterium]|nr:KpsF/GutQ family sugar-phosphate isomerase [Planctomycetales bacterium]
MSPDRLRANEHTDLPPQLWVERGQQVLRAESQALQTLAHALDASFARAVQMLLDCRGSVVVCGMGKAGLVGKKLAASLSSTGTPSYFLHPAEAVHGDLGSVRAVDTVILLSYSGETEEITRLLPYLQETSAATLALTAHADSTLGSRVDLPLLLGSQKEACALGLAPSCSTTAMLALGDALALVVSEQRGFTREQFARFHPAGSLGKQLTPVDEVMRPLAACRVAHYSHTVRQVLIDVGRPGRRTGAVMLTDAERKLVGIFTDSDLARLLESDHAAQLERPISEVMIRNFQTIASGTLLPEAVNLLAQRKISELPVVNETMRPLGILDITDVMSVVSAPWSQPQHALPASSRPQILSLAAYRSPQA